MNNGFAIIWNTLCGRLSHKYKGTYVGRYQSYHHKLASADYAQVHPIRNQKNPPAWWDQYKYAGWFWS